MKTPSGATSTTANASHRCLLPATLRAHIEMLSFDPVTCRKRSANLEQAFWSIGAGDPFFDDAHARGIGRNGVADGGQMGLDRILAAGLLSAARQAQRNGHSLFHSVESPG